MDREQVERIADAADAAKYTFLKMIDAYVKMRMEIDPEWKDIDFDAFEDDVEFYVDGDVELEWRRDDHCDSYDYFRRDFPASDLWDPDVENRIRAEVAEKQAAATRVLEKRREAAEQHERKMLEALRLKYDVSAEEARDA